MVNHNIGETWAVRAGAESSRWKAFGLSVVWIAVVLAGLELRFHFFTTSIQMVQPSSDESIAMLQAQNIRHGHFPLLMMGQPYLFPIESYLMAPFEPLLPTSALGARLLPFLFSLVTLGLSLVVLRRVAHGVAAWVGGSLILIPSCYALMMQSAVALPGYTALLLGLMATVLAADQARQHARPGPWLLLTGFLAGLSFSSHMLALCYGLPCILFALFGGKAWTSFRRWMALVLGALLGLLPHFAATLFLPGAHQAVSGHRALDTVLARLWDPILVHTALGALGVLIPHFPDDPAYPGLTPGWETSFSVGLGLLLAGLVFYRLGQLARNVVRRQAIRWEVSDIFLGTVLVNMLLLAGSERGDGTNYRYLLPTAVSLPFLLAWLARQGSAWQLTSAVIAVGLVALNFASSESLIATWSDTNFAAACGIADLQPTLDFLRDNQICHAVASYGVAYRITYLSRGTVLCAQPSNERFPGWPLPYKAKVDQSRRVAYVLTDAEDRLAPSQFREDLAALGLTCTVHTEGLFQVFHDFAADPRSDYGERMPVNWSRVTTESSAAVPDGASWLESTWAEPVSLQRAVLVFSGHETDEPAEVSVQLKGPRGWEPFLENQPAPFASCEVRNGHPVYGRATYAIRLHGRSALGLRVATSRKADLELYRDAASPRLGK